MPDPAADLVTDVLAVDQAVVTSSGSTGYGVTETGFVPKPYARLVAEKLATARALLGEDLDLTGGSVLRKLLEISALEDARTWSALAAWYDDSFLVSATGTALDRLGEELGLPRPWEQARGSIDLSLATDLPSDVPSLTLARGARLLTDGGHHASLDETVVLSAASPERTVSVTAFQPGPGHNLDPTATDAAGEHPQQLVRFHPDDPAVAALVALEQRLGAPAVAVAHDRPLTGGELRWPDARYRELALRAPRSLWRADAIELAVSLLPGVRQVVVRDSWGGLDLTEAVFGGFRFAERLFSTERDVVSPFFVQVLVAPTPAAIWEGPDGLRAAVETEIEDLRPAGIFPQVLRAHEVGVGLAGLVTVQGVPLPAGSQTVVNASSQGRALKSRLLDRVRAYVESLRLGDPVRWSEVMYALMSEPGVVDVTGLVLLRFPPGLDSVDLTQPQPQPGTVQEYQVGENITLLDTQVAVAVDDDTRLVVA